MESRGAVTVHRSRDTRTAELKRLFPEAFDAAGRIDFDRLRLALGHKNNGEQECFGLVWPGKAACIQAVHSPPAARLIPVPEESIRFDSTENLIIEGDNLDALKLLRRSHAGRIKLIYIDPPYNTGNHFIYPDNYAEPLGAYLKRSQAGRSSTRRGAGTVGTGLEGRFHSQWLNMIYPRLFLARELLRDDGVVFISIDEHEVDNLKRVCNEIFGEEHFVGTIVNVNNPKGRSDDKYIATAHEYLLVYKKGETRFGGWKPEVKVTRRYNRVDRDGRRYREIDLRKTGDADRRTDRPRMFYYFLFHQATGELRATRESNVPTGWIQIRPIREDGTDGRWRWGLEKAQRDHHLLVPKWMPVRRMWGVFEMDYLLEDEQVKPTSVWSMKEINSERGPEELTDLGFPKDVFPRPKPVGLVRRILDIATTRASRDIVLDFFAGSGVTAQAVLEANSEDGGNRQFILVQIPEPVKGGPFPTISDITKERVRRVIRRLEERAAGQTASDNTALPLGFRVYRSQPAVAPPPDHC